MLCDSCTDYRFPDSKRIQQPDMVATRSAKLRAINNSAPIKSTSSFKVTPVNNLLCVECNHDATHSVNLSSTFGTQIIAMYFFTHVVYMCFCCSTALSVNYLFGVKCDV